MFIIDNHHGEAGEIFWRLQRRLARIHERSGVGVRIPFRGQWKRHGESCALPLSLAVGANRSPVQLDQVAHYCESESQPAVHSGEGAVGLSEAIEHIGQKFFTDAFAAIGDGDPRTRGVAL